MRIVADAERSIGNHRSKGIYKESSSGGDGGEPRPLVVTEFTECGAEFSPDGRGFLMFQDLSQASDSDHEHIRVVLNWFDELDETFAQFEQ